MGRFSDMDERFVHQTPDVLELVHHQSPYWRESYFFGVHSPDGLGDSLFFTFAHFPARRHMDSLQMGCVGGERILGVLSREVDGDGHVTVLDGAHVEIVKPLEELHLWADPAVAQIGLDLTFRGRTRAYGLRRGTMRTHDALVWDQSHMLQAGTYHGTYTVNGEVHQVDGWRGVRDHSWGIREHGRCPLWLWFQIQLDDGFLGVWHWEFENGARVYSDGCWAAADGSAPVPVIDFRHAMEWIGADGAVADYGEHGEAVAGLRGECEFTLEGGRRVAVTAEGRFDRPYEPFHRGGLNQMRVRTDDGREGTAIYEVTGSRHHRYFPDTVVPGVLPA